MQQVTIKFPDLRLSQRDGHKIRGYFSQLFGQESDLWHNHQSDGKPIYRYPLIQYKVIGGIPMLVGFNQGADILIGHFLQLNTLEIEGHQWPIHSKQVERKAIKIGVNGQLYQYEFMAPWFALNQANFQKYRDCNAAQRTVLLKRLLIGNVITFFKGMDYQEEKEIQLIPSDLQPLIAKFKNQQMTMFKGRFVCNTVLPDFGGLGKSVARGFGTIKRIS